MPAEVETVLQLPSACFWLQQVASGNDHLCPLVPSKHCESGNFKPQYSMLSLPALALATVTYRLRP